MTNYQKLFEKDFSILEKKYNDKDEELKQLKYEYQLLTSKYQTKCSQVENAYKAAEEKFMPILNEKDKIILEQNNEIERLKSLLNLDGTNTGIPTSKTPFNKKKIIPNSREKTDKKIGGQVGHKKHKLEKFKDEEVTEVVVHSIEKCPSCGGNLEKKDEVYKDELSFKIVPIKRRHVFEKYECECCHKEIHEEIPSRLKEENQYGSEVQALALSLANEGNMPMNKIRRIIKGITHNEINMSEGYIAKLQKRASKGLDEFNKELHHELLKQDTVYWDDTVIMINQKQSCMRFYGTKRLAYYTAHKQKNKDGIDDDGILNTLSPNTKVMHDHNIVNYNSEYSFINIECNEHLKRDLQKCYDNTTHEWCIHLKELLKQAQHDRKRLVEENVNEFEEDYLINFDTRFNDIILDGIEENNSNKRCHYYKKELALLNRILDYKENYFMWLYNFNIPCDNNLSERSLRGIKSKMKISGQFQNIDNASNFGIIRSYIETCYRNEINPTEALTLLMENNPLKLSSIIKE